MQNEEVEEEILEADLALQQLRDLSQVGVTERSPATAVVSTSQSGC